MTFGIGLGMQIELLLSAKAVCNHKKEQIMDSFICIIGLLVLVVAMIFINAAYELGKQVDEINDEL
jgi:hypothetical protein